MIYKEFIQSGSVHVARVTFILPSSVWADQVHLVGDFNDWSHTASPMHRNRDGEWWITVDLEPDRRYEFRYLCDDDRWMNDDKADGYVPNPHGLANCLVDTRADE